MTLSREERDALARGDDGSASADAGALAVSPAEVPTGVPHLARACELLWQAGHPAIAEALEREVRQEIDRPRAALDAAEKRAEEAEAALARDVVEAAGEGLVVEIEEDRDQWRACAVALAEGLADDLAVVRRGLAYAKGTLDHLARYASAGSVGDPDLHEDLREAPSWVIGAAEEALTRIDAALARYEAVKGEEER